ncbi:MAG: hypothetical protein ABGW77_01825 [Campylobacterales bacterium]
MRVGEFKDEEPQNLFDRLVAKGSQSPTDGLTKQRIVQLSWFIPLWRKGVSTFDRF